MPRAEVAGCVLLGLTVLQENNNIEVKRFNKRMTVSVQGSHLQVVQTRKFRAHTLLALQVHCYLAAPLPVWTRVRSLFKNRAGDILWQTFHFQLCSSLEVGLWVGPPLVGLRLTTYRSQKVCSSRLQKPHPHASLWWPPHLLLTLIFANCSENKPPAPHPRLRLCFWWQSLIFYCVCVSMFVYVHSIPYMLKVLCLSASLPVFMCICVPVLLVRLGAQIFTQQEEKENVHLHLCQKQALPNQ